MFLVLTYDMDTTHDNNINAEIKRYLINLGWQDVIRFENDPRLHLLPETTLIKLNQNDTEIANDDFVEAKRLYNEAHSDENLRAVSTKAVIFRADYCQIQ